MKLNLLPTHVSREGQTKTAWVGAALIVVLSALASVGLIVYSNQQLESMKSQAEELKPQADAALAKAQEADQIIGGATGLDRNLQLASAMGRHCSAYVDLYRDVLRYIPTFFRVTSISATPGGSAPDDWKTTKDVQCNVTITGVIRSHQQYADIMLALLRIPGALNVTRSGYVINDPYVPALSESDQNGSPIRPGESSLPSDPIERMDALIARAASQPSGYQNVSGFGSTEVVRGSMPDWSTVTFVLTLNNRNLFVPDAKSTLSSSGNAAAAAPAAGFGAMGGPSMPGAPSLTGPGMRPPQAGGAPRAPGGASGAGPGTPAPVE